MNLSEKYKPNKVEDFCGSLKIRMNIINPFFQSWNKNRPFLKGLVLRGEEGNGRHTLMNIYANKYNLEVVKYNKNNISTHLFGKNINGNRYLVLTEVKKFTKLEMKAFLKSKNPIIFFTSYKYPKEIMKLKINDVNLFNIVNIGKPKDSELVDLLKNIYIMEKGKSIESKHLWNIVQKCPSIRSAIQTLQGCMMADNFEDINVRDIDETPIELVRRIFNGKKTDININAITISNYLYANNVESECIRLLLYFEYIGREYGVNSNLWKEWVKCIRGDSNKIVFPKRFKKKEKKKEIPAKEEYKKEKKEKVVLEQKDLSRFFG